jgi:putative transcriptional regulator
MSKLRDYREYKGISQARLAQHLGVNRATYAQYEREPERMSIAQAKSVCAFLGCTVDEIFLSANVN